MLQSGKIRAGEGLGRSKSCGGGEEGGGEGTFPLPHPPLPPQVFLCVSPTPEWILPENEMERLLRRLVQPKYLTNLRLVEAQGSGLCLGKFPGRVYYTGDIFRRMRYNRGEGTNMSQRCMQNKLDITDRSCRLLSWTKAWIGTLQWRTALDSKVRRHGGFNPRVINFKFPLQPHQKYYIIQNGELGFSQMSIYFQFSLPHLYLSIEKVGRMYLPYYEHTRPVLAPLVSSWRLIHSAVRVFSLIFHLSRRPGINSTFALFFMAGGRLPRIHRGLIPCVRAADIPDMLFH